jgi:hypothetical protein
MIKFSCDGCGTGIARCGKGRIIKEVIGNLGIDNCKVSCNFYSKHTDSKWVEILSSRSANVVICSGGSIPPDRPTDSSVMGITHLPYERVGMGTDNITVFITPLGG